MPGTKNDSTTELPPTRAFLLSTLIAEVAVQSLRFALLSRADAVGGSTTGVALVLFAEAGIALLVGIIGGPLLDRYDPRIIAILSNVWRGLTAFGLLYAQSIPALIGFVALFALGDGLYVPARTSLVVQLAGEKGLLALNSKVGAAQGAALVLGPGLWAATRPLFGDYVVLSGLAFAFVFSGLLLFLVRGYQGSVSASYLQELKEGIRFVLSSQTILVGLVLIALGLFFVGGFYPLLPAIARWASPENHETGLELIAVSLGVGAILGAAIAPKIISTFGRGKVAIITTMLDGVFFAGFTLSLGLWGTAIWTTFWGMVILVSLITFTTIFQEESPEKFRGRVLALLPPLQGAGTALSFALVAALALWVSEREIVLVGGVILVLMTLCTLLFSWGRRFARL